MKKKIREARLKAAFSVNHALLKIYWEIGNTISHQQDARGWGAKTVDTLSRDLRAEFTDMKGLSPRNLRYMRDFAVAIRISHFCKSHLPNLPMIQFCKHRLPNCRGTII